MKSLSRAQLLATPWTAAHQAPPSMGFARQEYWSGVPSPSPLTHLQRRFWDSPMLHYQQLSPFVCWVYSMVWICVCVCVCVCSVVQSCLTLCDLMDCNPPGSSVGGISQARILEWTPIHFSRESFRPKDLTCDSCAGRRVLTTKLLQKLRVWTHHTFLTPSPVDGHYLLTASLGQLWIMLPSRFVYKSLCGQVLFFLECYPEVELNEGCVCWTL